MSGHTAFSACEIMSMFSTTSHTDFCCRLELAQQTGGEPALLNLLRVYKNFCPDIIIGTTSANIPQSTVWISPRTASGH